MRKVDASLLILIRCGGGAIFCRQRRESRQKNLFIGPNPYYMSLYVVLRLCKRVAVRDN